MKVRLGYACISETLNNVTSSSSYTYTNFVKENNYSKLDRIIKSNFNDLEKIITYNIKNNIHFYRLSSNIIPLATKREVNFNYLDKYNDYYKKISNLINNNKLRIDFHPSEFCVLNSVNDDVVFNSINILKYHYSLLEYFNINPKVLILHVGSSALGKDLAIMRFIDNYKKLDLKIRQSIVIENDDKVFNIDDCIYISKILNIPIVFDYHHYICNHSDSDVFKQLEYVFSTWKGINPKIHFSSPKSHKNSEFRSHNDYIDSDTFIEFVEKCKKMDYDIDIMIEAKKKDEALFRLVREIKYKTNYKFIDETSFIC